MFVHLKQSGELLRAGGEPVAPGKPSPVWTPNGVRLSTEKLVAAHREREKLGIDGLLVISGAGNIVRGEDLENQHIASGMGDFLGRLATIQNTIVLEKALAAQRVPVSVFIAETMGLVDATIDPDYFQPYDVEAVNEAYARERIVLIAGGTGEDGKTTDNAVLEYAKRQQAYKPEGTALILKGTKYDGVYERDPARFADERRFAIISAEQMIENHDQLGTVDISCLEQIRDSELKMRVYADGQHDLLTVIAQNGGSSIGTLIVAGQCEAVWADA